MTPLPHVNLCQQRQASLIGARRIRENQNLPNSRNKNGQIEEPLSESSRNKNGKVRVLVEKSTHTHTHIRIHYFYISIVKP